VKSDEGKWRHVQGSCSCPSAGGHPETMKTTPHPNSPSPSSLSPGRGKRGRGERVRGLDSDSQRSRSCPSADGHPETMKIHASQKRIRVRGGLDLLRNRAGSRPTLQWCFEPAEQSGQDAATNPKLMPRKRARKADCICAAPSGVPRARPCWRDEYGNVLDHGCHLPMLCRFGCA